MKLTITINQDNAAFEDSPAIETARILRAVAKKIEGGQMDGALMDINGNKVGRFETEQD